MVTGEWLLTQLDRATGKVVWKETVLKAPIEPIHRKNSRASSTPATDGKAVVVSFWDEEQMFVAADDFEGNGHSKAPLEPDCPLTPRQSFTRKAVSCGVRRGCR